MTKAKRIINPDHLKVPQNFCRIPNGYGVVKICVSGAAETGHCGLDAYEKAKEVGREIAQQGAIITTGATTGFPLYSAMGAKDLCGFSVGFSPAATEREHLETYQLPLDYMDVIVYTGFGYVGRNMLLVRSSDAVIIGCGRIGTINEFTIAYEDQRPIGILEGEWETDKILQHIVEASHRPNDKVVYDSDPKALVGRLVEMVMEDKKKNMVYNNHDGYSGTGKGDALLL